MTKWRYGNAWERYPIKPGEVWVHWESGSKICVQDLRDGLPVFMTNVDMIYCDPPWSKGNVNAFVTKAGLDRYVQDYRDFMSVFFRRIREINPLVCYLEIGKQHLSDFERNIQTLFPAVQIWPILYYYKRRCFLVRGGAWTIDVDFTDMDDGKTPTVAIAAESKCQTIADICTGRGLTMLAAHKLKRTFYGSELNPWRLAVAIERVAKMGVYYECQA